MQSLRRGLELFNRGTIRAIRSGENTNVWVNNWIGVGSLRQNIVGPTKGEEKLRVKELFDNKDGWNLEPISFNLPKEIRDKILSTPRKMEGVGRDVLTWGAEASGIFSPKSAWEMLTATNSAGKMEDWSWIWKVKNSSKVKHFLWLVKHRKLATNENLCHRKIIQNSTCGICSNEEENCEHIIFKCQEATQLWNKLQLRTKLLQRPDDSLDSWLRKGVLCSDPSKFSNIKWGTIFSSACWSLWLARNQRVFRNNSPPLDPFLLTLALSSEYSFLGPTQNSREESKQILVGWSPPKESYYKLNTDGAARGNPGDAGAGGVIRDHLGQWVIGFGRRIRIGSNILAELWGLRDGLRTALDLHSNKLEVELDAKIVVDFINSSDSPNHVHSNLIDDCRWLMSLFEDISIRHSFRETNQVADYLAKAAIEQQHDFCIYHAIPTGLGSLLNDDCRGVCFPQFVPAGN